MNEKKKLAFLLMSADIIHPGHLNIIHEALKLDATIMIGLYSDEAIASYKRVPFMNFEQRKEVLSNIKGVDIVIEQKTRDVTETLLKYKPDYFVHGTDWRNGALAKERQNIIDTISAWGGQLVEPEYTKGICSSNAHAVLKERGTTPEKRYEKLFKSVDIKKKLRACNVYDCLTAKAAESAIVKNVGQPAAEFDAFWLDIHTIAEIKGKASSNLVDFSEMHLLLNDISSITTKPFIFNYGKIVVSEQFTNAAMDLEKLGVSIISIEPNENQTLNDLRKIISKTKLELRENKIKFAINITNEVNIEDIKEYFNIGFEYFILDGEINEIEKNALIIKNEIPFSTLMAFVNHLDNNEETKLYNSNINVLIYKEDLLKNIKTTINDELLTILGK